MSLVVSRTGNNKEKRRAFNQEDIKHILEEVWDFDLDETFCKIFSIESRLGVYDVLFLSKDYFHELSRKTDDRYAVYLRQYK